MWRFNAFCLSLPLTSARLSDIKTKSVIETFLFSQIFSQSLKRDEEGGNNAHVTDIYSPARENYIPRKRGWLLLICPTAMREA